MENFDDKEIINDFKQLERINEIKKQKAKEELLSLKDEIQKIAENPKEYHGEFVTENKIQFFEEFMEERKSSTKKKSSNFFHKLLKYL